MGIISILATIALPNFLEAQVRAKIARVKNDMRTMATALETYAALHNKYPKRHYGDDNYKKTYTPNIIPPLNTKAQDLKVLTTPIAFLTSLPVDVFDPHVPPPNNLIDYYDEIQAQRIYNFFQIQDGAPSIAEEAIKAGRWRNYGWMLVSVGPDGFINWYSPNLGYPDLYRGNSYYRTCLYTIYDPVWGTVSCGNIYRFQNDPEPEAKSNHIKLYSEGKRLTPP
ncbi:MAG: hypothetical protein Kow0059_07880 [Candidatus Sumerlaeia bacterium]